eukprot:5264325-Prymnesium_polylepis.1
MKPSKRWACTCTYADVVHRSGCDSKSEELSRSHRRHSARQLVNSANQRWRPASSAGGGSISCPMALGPVAAYGTLAHGPAPVVVRNDDSATASDAASAAARTRARAAAARLGWLSQRHRRGTPPGMSGSGLGSMRPAGRRERGMLTSRSRPPVQHSTGRPRGFFARRCR